MQKTSIPGSIIALAAITLILIFHNMSCTAQPMSEVVHIATDDEKRGGALVELTTIVFARMGMGVHIDYLPWTRVMKKGHAGKYDMILGAYYTKERARDFVYSHPIGKVELVFVKRAGEDIQFTSLEALRPYRIGYIRGAASNPEFEQAAKDFLHVEYVSYYEYNIRKLLAGRIDLLVDKKFMVEKTLREKYPEAVNKVEYLTPPLQSFAFHNMFPKIRPNHKMLLQMFNTGLLRIKENGILHQIYRRHYFEQGPDPLPAETLNEDNFAIPEPRYN